MTWGAVLLKTHWPNNWWLICVWNSYIGCHSSSTTLLAGADPEMEERECTDCCTCSVELAMCQAHSIVRGSEGMLSNIEFLRVLLSLSGTIMIYCL